VIVYGHRSFLLDPRAFLTDLTKRFDHAGAVPPHDDLVELLIDVGEAEAGVADSVMPDVDAEADELNGWREIAGAVAAGAGLPGSTLARGWAARDGPCRIDAATVCWDIRCCCCGMVVSGGT
jgi:hypothetical protein